MTDDYDYYQCPPEIAQEIDNWRRWAVCRDRRLSRCQSIESRYKSTYPEPKFPQIQVNIIEAVEIERIIRALPKKNKGALKAYHIERMPANMMRRKLGERDIGCLLINSWMMVKNMLDKRRKIDRVMITAEPSIDETDRREAA